MVSLIDSTLMEDPEGTDDECESYLCNRNTHCSVCSIYGVVQIEQLEFGLVIMAVFMFLANL